MVDGLGRRLGQLLDRDRGRGYVRVTEAEIDHVAPVAPELSLQLIDSREHVGGKIVNSPELQVAHLTSKSVRGECDHAG
jgi:hypothetical protein